MVAQGTGQPQSAKCLSKFITYWVTWAGWPSVLTTDRGTANRGEFARGLAANGVFQRIVGLESPELLGRAERHGGMWKAGLKAIVRAHNAVGKKMMKLAAVVNTTTKNEFSKVGGIAAAQWVLGKYPRWPGSMMEEEELGQL